MTRKTTSDRVAHGLCISASFAQQVSALRVLQTALRLAQPSGEEPYTDCNKDEPCGNPHDQAPELLAMQCGQTPRRRAPW